MVISFERSHWKSHYITAPKNAPSAQRRWLFIGYFTNYPLKKTCLECPVCMRPLHNLCITCIIECMPPTPPPIQNLATAHPQYIHQHTYSHFCIFSFAPLGNIWISIPRQMIIHPPLLILLCISFKLITKCECNEKTNQKKTNNKTTQQILCCVGVYAFAFVL